MRQKTSCRFHGAPWMYEGVTVTSEGAMPMKRLVVGPLFRRVPQLVDEWTPPVEK